MAKIELLGVRNPDLYGNQNGTFDLLVNMRLPAPGTLDPETYFTPVENPAWKDLGSSVYDPSYMIGSNPIDIQENRALEQPGIMLLINGNLKEITTAGTTFLDNTFGFLYGLGTGIYNMYDLNQKAKDTTFKENAYAFLQGMWDNDFNRAMSDFQDTMEKVAPNYYSLEELNNPWYTNILSANFIGDKVMKNMGFTQGAVLAMVATEGLGLAKLAGGTALAISKFALGNTGKLFGASRGTLATLNQISRNAGQLAHHSVQGAIGASGEASIEAINAVKEGSKDAYRNLYKRRLELIDQLDPNDPNYQYDLLAIEEAAKAYKEEIDAKFRDAGNSVYLANMAILSASNAIEFSSLLRGGFLRSAKLSNFERKLGDRIVNAEEFARGILAGEKASITNNVNKGFGRVLGKTAINSFTEGMEEASQNIASNSNQYQAKARLNQYADNTLLGTKINPEVTNELAQYSKAFSKALYDNFGAPESQGWEEFFLGALTGAMGTISLSKHAVTDELGNQKYDPITHKPLTSWKPRSISDIFQGGYFGAKKEIEEEYNENQLIVDAVNKRLTDPEFTKRVQHAVSSRTFEKLMDEALEENDMFKFKNSEIGKLVNDVFFFRDKGLIDEYKNIYQNMSNIDDKTLQLLYAATSNKEGETELAQEDMEEVREEYQNKAKKTLDKIQMILDYYDYIDLEYREEDPMFKEELAYLYIRLDDTKRRILELKEKGRKPNRTKAIMLGVLDSIQNDVFLDEEGNPYNSTLKLQYEDSFIGLSDSEKKDLKRLERQEKEYQRWINAARKKSSLVTNRIRRVYLESALDYLSKDVDSLIESLKNATSLIEIDLILGMSDESVKLEIINRAYLEGGIELQTKLKKLLGASIAYSESRKRLEEIDWGSLESKIFTNNLENLLYKIYIQNGLNLTEVRNTLRKVKDELKENSISTILDILPEAESSFSYFLDEYNEGEKEIFLDILEGTIEDVTTGIRSAETWKARKEADRKVLQKQLKVLQQKQLKEQQEEQDNDDIDKTTYVKQLSYIKDKEFREKVKAFGISKLDKVLKKAINKININTGEATDERRITNDNIFNKILLEATTIFSSDNPTKALEDAETRLSKFEKNHNIELYDIHDFFELLKDTLKKTPGKKSKNAEDSNTHNPDVEKKSTIKHEDGEVSSETIEKDGVKITKFTWWRKNKQDKVVPTIGGGLKIDVNDIDESSMDIDNIEDPILTELREADGKITGTIRYKLKGEKSRIEGEVTFKNNPVKKEPKEKGNNNLLPIVIAPTEIASLVKAFLDYYNLDPAILSVKELNEIIDNILRVVDLIKEEKTVPKELNPYYDIVIKNILPNKGIEGSGSMHAVSSLPNELNGAWRGYYKVKDGKGNPLQEMRGELADEKGLIASYESVQNAKKVQWTIDNILKNIKALNIPIRIIVPIDKKFPDGRPNTTMYTAVEYDKNKIKADKSNLWIIQSGGKEYVIIGTLGANMSSTEQKDFWQSIRDDIDSQLETTTLTGYYVSTNPLHVFKINNIGDGRPIKTHPDHQSTTNILELLTGKDTGRNPLKIRIQDLKWLIIYNDEPKSLRIKSTDIVRGNVKEAPGKVYVLIPTPSGVYYRHPVNPQTIKDVMNNHKDSALFKKVEKLINDIITNKKQLDIIKLKSILVLTRTKNYEDKSLLDIYFDSNNSSNDVDIKVSYTPLEGGQASNILSKDVEEAKALLFDIIVNKINPFINVSFAHLNSESEIRELSEAGALHLKGGLAVFSYVGANYTVVPQSVEVGGKKEGRPQSFLNPKLLEFRYLGKQIFKRNNDYYEGESLIDDTNLLEALKDIEAIEMGLYVGETLYKFRNGKKIIYEGLYYFVLKGNYLVIYHKDDKGNITKIDTSRYNSLKDLRDRSHRQTIKKTDLIATGESIDLDFLRKETPLQKVLNSIKKVLGSRIKDYETLYLELDKIDATNLSDEKLDDAIDKAFKTVDSIKEWYNMDGYRAKGINRALLEKAIRDNSKTKKPQIPIENTEMIPSSYPNIKISKNPILLNLLKKGDKFIVMMSNGDPAYMGISGTVPAIGTVLTVSGEDVVAIIPGLGNGSLLLNSLIVENKYLVLAEVNTDTLKESVEKRKQLAVKKATLDLELKKGLKVGDTIALPSKTLPSYKTIITGIKYSDIEYKQDSYSYSDIVGTPVITYLDDGLEYEIPISEILSTSEYKKINKEPQKPLKGLSTSEFNSNFAKRLANLKEDTTDIEEILESKALEIAKEKGIEFQVGLSFEYIFLWYLNNAKYNLNAIPSDADAKMVTQLLIENCK